jgi:transcription initiation factor TFIIIB Brf1 subunit/transcription initiation factor TFIIB
MEKSTRTIAEIDTKQSTTADDVKATKEIKIKKEKTQDIHEILAKAALLKSELEAKLLVEKRTKKESTVSSSSAGVTHKKSKEKNAFVEQAILDKQTVKPEKKFMCPFCNKQRTLIIVDPANNPEEICSVCGYVNQTKQDWIYQNLDQKSSGSKDSIPEMYNYRHYTYSNRDYSGRKISSNFTNTLNNTYLRTKSFSSKQRSKFKGLVELSRLYKQMNIHQTLVNEVNERYLDLNHNGCIKNRNVYAICIALLVVVANFENVPLTIGEALKHTTVSRKRFSKEYFYLLSLFPDSKPNCASGDRHLEKFLSFIEPSWKLKTKVSKQIPYVMESINFSALQGRTAVISCGSVIYHILKYYNYEYLESFVKYLFINRLTLKNCWAQLLKDHPFLERYHLVEKQNSSAQVELNTITS